MTVKTTLSFTDRHAAFLKRKVEEGVYASQSAAVAAAIETAIQDETARETALTAMADEIRARMNTPREEYLSQEELFATLKSFRE